jgi:hypothetical protein
LVVSGEARLRSWFLRNLLEAAERELGVAALATLPDKVPSRIRPHVSLDRLRGSIAVDSIPLDEGEEVLLGVDSALGDGSGKLLERISREMHSRQLLAAKGTVRIGDLIGTVARLRGPLEHAFIDTDVLFELARTELGFTLTVGIAGRPRATRALRHLAQGAILAAERFARETQTTNLRLQGETFADRAVITINVRRTSEPPPEFEPPTLRRPPSLVRMPVSLADEVSRILDPSLAATRARAITDENRDSPLPKPSFSGRLTPTTQSSSAALTTPGGFDPSPSFEDRAARRPSRTSDRPSAPETALVRGRLPSNPPPSFPDIPTVTLRRPSEPPPRITDARVEPESEIERKTTIPPPRLPSRPPPSEKP